jgi:hypothetical protein
VERAVQIFRLHEFLACCTISKLKNEFNQDRARVAVCTSWCTGFLFFFLFDASNYPVLLSQKWNPIERPALAFFFSFIKEVLILVSVFAISLFSYVRSTWSLDFGKKDTSRTPIALLFCTYVIFLFHSPLQHCHCLLIVA